MNRDRRLEACYAGTPTEGSGIRSMADLTCGSRLAISSQRVFFQFANSGILLIQLGILVERIQGEPKTVEKEDGVEITHGEDTPSSRIDLLYIEYNWEHSRVARI